MTIPIIKAIAALIATATLGTGATGTATAAGLTDTRTDAAATTVTATADTSSLPDHLINGTFDYPTCPGGKASCDVDPTTGWGGFYKDFGGDNKFAPIDNWDRSKFGWDSDQEGMRPDQQPTSHQKLQHCVQLGHANNNNGQKVNRYAEIIAETPTGAIYQDIATVPGVMYRWTLKHASASTSHADSMAVMIGDPGKETAQEATRTTVNGYGDKLGKVGTTITTKGPGVAWETYTGTYIATSTVTRFTYRSLQGDTKLLHTGNWIDDVSFDKAYKLTYDKNASDATGQVPSDQYGKENTTQPAKTNGNGKVRLASDTTALSDHLVNGDFSVNYHDQWKNTDWTSIDPNNGRTLITANWKWYAIDGWDKAKFAWSSTQKAGSNIEQKANAVELQYDAHADNMYAELCAYEAGTAIYQDLKTVPGTLYKVRLKHASLSSAYLDKMQVMIGSPGHETPVEMTRTTVNGHGDKLNEKSTTIATKATNSNDRDHGDQWETYEGTYIIPANQTVTRFTFKSVDARSLNKGNVLDDIVFDKAYRLSYDKNASDASGSVPSNERGKENTVQPAKAKTTGTLRLASDDDVAAYAASNLPEQIVNGGFDYPSVPSWTALPESGSNKYNKGKLFATVNPGTGKYGSGCAMSATGRAIPNWNRVNFAWNSTQGDAHHSGGMSCEAGNVELNYDSVHHNQFAELTADQQGTAIYQDVKVTPGTMMKWSLKHSSATSAYVDKMQVMIGEPYKETAQEATRITSENGNKVGEKMTTISTPTTSDRADNKKWDTYSGTYLVPDKVTTVRFTFKSIASAEWYSGNDLDDIKFSRSYQLSYDKNASDATGSVPSNQRGKENTVQPAEAKTTGTVKTVADDDSSKSLTVNPGFDVPDYSKLDDGGLHWMYVSPAEGKAWSYYDYINPAQPKHQVAGLSQATFGWRELTGGDHKTTAFELHREKDGNVCADVHGGRTFGQTIDTQAGVAYTVSIRHSGRSKGNAGSVQVLVGPDKDHLRPLEMSRMNVSRTGAKYGDRIGKVGTVITTHSDSVDSTEGDHPAWDHADDWETYSGTYVATGGKTVFAYRGVDKNGNAVSGNDSVADSVIDDLSFKLAYRLSYDKNAQDAAGSIPSDTAANTTRPAKSETDGKVSDLVQRTTTHADGSVTVKTIDTSTDVVSGCQVYYPVGAKIRLATLAKDDDCWDSTMLTRPDVDGRKMKMLGWSESRYQDDNAGALSTITPTVTMPVGGKTVYAVWVSSGVTLTYNVNTPEGITPPVTPNGITVPYNTVINDTSGWKTGSTTIIPGYRFLGWYTDPRDVIEPTDPRCEIYPTLTMCQPQTVPLYPSWGRALTADITVYAHWERADTQVMYDANGGKGSHAPTDGHQHSTITMPSDVSRSFSRDGYSFAGWNTRPDGSGVSYRDGDGVPVEDKVVTLYAQWRAKIFVMPEAGGDGGPSPLTVIPAVIAGLALMVGLAGTRRRFKASRQTGRHGR